MFVVIVCLVGFKYCQVKMVYSILSKKQVLRGLASEILYSMLELMLLSDGTHELVVMTWVYTIYLLLKMLSRNNVSSYHG